jgi:hypothetical protein
MSEWKRRRALRTFTPLRFLDRWCGGGVDHQPSRIAVECDLFHGLPSTASDLFHGLPSPSMRAWIDRGESP